MISKIELHKWALEEGLRFDQIERDYVMLWILSGITHQQSEPTAWIFKGGTCLRHCYYPGYRFSEDIDFSCRSSEDGVERATAVLRRVVAWVREATGMHIEVGRVRTIAEELQVEITISYTRGQTDRRSLPSIKVHLTFDELILTEPKPCSITPRYSDLSSFTIYAYSLLEILAEKMRALLQQQDKWPRPRDLYDLWFLVDQRSVSVNPAELYALFVRKCTARQIVPDLARLTSDQLREWNEKAWRSHLEPLMVAIPDFATVWETWRRQCQAWFSTLKVE